ncbi:NUDIX hydrolase [Rhizobium sp. BK376]|uniref:NUDIX hydrolase n=1 Tax=Rhizobium sp. BK376 TaxID=2512149 RepID=UPI0010474333|nr:NUDIX hydrolase [Rhizobium sp. BK376]
MERDPKPWSVTASRITYQDRWIKVRSDDCLTADGTLVAPFHVLEYPDWINVVPVMPDGRVLLVREYRHGRGEIVLGVVAGGVEESDRRSDDPAMEAAKRELLEETGYEADRFVKILVTHPNSATHNNIHTTYLALGLNKVAEQSLDESEDVQVLFRPLDDVLRDLQSGALIMQGMHVAALYAAAHWLKINGGLK